MGVVFNFFYKTNKFFVVVKNDNKIKQIGVSPPATGVNLMKDGDVIGKNLFLKLKNIFGNHFFLKKKK